VIRIRVLIAGLLAGCVSTAFAAGPGTMLPPRVHAAVYLVRGSVVGSNVGAYGPYVRESDTTWRRLSRSNLITFGFGAAVRDGARRLYVAAGNGLHRSTDDGATWKIITNWKTMEILSVLPDAQDEKRVLVSSPWGVYRTTDDGATWNESMKGMRPWYVRSLVYDLFSSRTIYAKTEDDIYLSSDRGENWRPMHAGAGVVTSFLQLPGSPGRFLAAFEDQGISMTTDGGKTWRKTDTPSQTSIYAIAASADGAVLYAGGWRSGVWRSTNGGMRWEQMWRDDAVESFFCFLVDPAQPDHVYAGTDGNGVYESSDGGMHWSFAGLRGGKIKHLFIYP
jgi:hypothetical protein